jgi:uncharacterized membrane protein YGL010W
MLGRRTSEQWIAQYASSHTHPVNRFCHSLGIPLIVVSLALAVAAIFYHPLWMLAAGLFVFGWLLQFIGHAFERKQPEFFHDWRFLLVGVGWWWAKMHRSLLPITGVAKTRIIAFAKRVLRVSYALPLVSDSLF